MRRKSAERRGIPARAKEEGSGEGLGLRLQELLYDVFSYIKAAPPEILRRLWGKQEGHRDKKEIVQEKLSLLDSIAKRKPEDIRRVLLLVLDELGEFQKSELRLDERALSKERERADEYTERNSLLFPDAMRDQVDQYVTAGIALAANPTVGEDTKKQYQDIRSNVGKEMQAYIQTILRDSDIPVMRGENVKEIIDAIEDLHQQYSLKPEQYKKKFSDAAKAKMLKTLLVALRDRNQHYAALITRSAQREILERMLKNDPSVATSLQGAQEEYRKLCEQRGVQPKVLYPTPMPFSVGYYPIELQNERVATFLLPHIRHHFLTDAYKELSLNT